MVFQKIKKNFPKNWIQQGSYDIAFLWIVMLLLCIGVVMMYSASYVFARYSADAKYNPSFYFFRQLGFAVAGVIIMLLISRLNTAVLKYFAVLATIVYLALLVMVLIRPDVREHKEEFKRWLKFGPISFQPSEIAKFGLVLICAKILSMRKKLAEQFKGHDLAIPICVLIIGLTAFLIEKENHLSCTILILGIGGVMLVLGGIRTPWIIAAVSAAVAGVTAIVIGREPLIKKLPIGAYQQDRLIAWLDKDSFADTIRWQTNQSLYAIGSGGLFGQGIGNSKQKHLYMPEPQNDFIFSIVCEELGFVGAVVILVLFALLIWRGFVIAMNCEKRFGTMLVMGIITQVGLQTILNVLVVTDAIPNTGISLPFFSYGGSSLMMLLVEMGIVLSVSRMSNIQKK